MRVMIADKDGIARETRGQIVELVEHPRFKNTYRFQFNKDYWMCSEYAIGKIIE